MKNFKNLLLVSTLFSTTLNSCSSDPKDYMGVQEYDDSVENVNNGYNQIENPLTYSDLKKYTDYPTFTPSEGNVNLLAIPISFADSKFTTAEQISTVKSNIQKSLFGSASDTGWESVSSFYSKSSFGKLNISGKVSDPYRLSDRAKEFANKVNSRSYSINQLLNDAITWYKNNNPSEDITKYDYDKDGYLDGVYFIYLHEYFAMDETFMDLDTTVFWAFCSWTYNNPSTTSPNVGVYFWCSYYFLFEGYGENSLDAHTFIHETGHMLGLDDYYSYNSISYGGTTINPSPLGGVDMMDYNITDHNAFSKFALGWNKPYLIDKEGKLTIKKASTSGECVIIPTSSYNNTSFDEYIMLELFSPDELNDSDLNKGYAPRDPIFLKNGKLNSVGIKAYHVDARLFLYDYGLLDLTPINYIYELDKIKNIKDNEYIFVAHSNTPDGVDAEGKKVDSYNYNFDSRFRLIQIITPEGVNYQSTDRCISNNSLFYKKGYMELTNSTFKKQFPNGKEKNKANNESNFLFNFKVEEMSKDSCTLSFTKIN